MPFPRFLMGPDFLIELIYSVIVMFSCLVVYFKTREIYNLSSYKSIKYFRMTFLFFAISYFLRFFSRVVTLMLALSGPMFFPIELSPLTVLLLVYTGLMTTFYLFYSISIKRLGKILPEETDYLHVLAIFISSIVVFLSLAIIYVAISLLLLVIMLFLNYSDYASSERRKSLHPFGIVYFLLIMFLMLNIFDVLIPGFFVGIRTVIYIISLLLFLLILYKVLKILRVESNDRKKKQAKNNLRHS